MAISLYDATVATYLQTLGAVEGFLKKTADHCASNGTELGELVETRLYPDMLPLRFQLISVWHHSLGAVRGAQAGEFTPPPSLGEPGYADLQKLVAEARTELSKLSVADIEALEGRDVVFKLGSFTIPFTGAGFLLSFSIPNFMFHSSTAYDILRMKGAPLGKRDFMGQLRMKS